MEWPTIFHLICMFVLLLNFFLLSVIYLLYCWWSICCIFYELFVVLTINYFCVAIIIEVFIYLFIWSSLFNICFLFGIYGGASTLHFTTHGKNATHPWYSWASDEAIQCRTRKIGAAKCLVRAILCAYWRCWWRCSTTGMWAFSGAFH